jgi:hypothetical protein
LTILDSNGKPFENITKSENGDSFVHCVVCNSDISVGMMGIAAAIRQHQRGKKHKEVVNMMEFRQNPEPKITKYRYVDSMATEFQHITKSEKGDSFAHCTVCNTDINVSTMGKTAIRRHQSSDKHQNAIAKIGPQSTRSDGRQLNMPSSAIGKSQKRKETGIRIGATSANADSGFDTHHGGNAPLANEQGKKHKSVMFVDDRVKG